MPPCPVPLCRAAATRPSHRRKAIIPTYAAASPMPDPHLSFPSPGRSTEEEKMPPPHARCLVLNRALRRRRAPNSANDKQPAPSKSGGSSSRSLASMVTGVIPSTLDD